MTPDFDVVVVGAGIAGAVTAHRLAAAGHSVALIDRADVAGAKNLSGGVLYTPLLTEAFPTWPQEAPVERTIVGNVLGLIGRERSTFIDCQDPTLATPPSAVSVLRAHLDPWLTAQAEQAGAFVMNSVRVDRALVEDGRVVGVQAGTDQLRAHVVVAADGVNSFLARGIGLRPAPPLAHLAVGIKAVIELPPAALQDRFHLNDTEGKAYALVGDVTQAVAGGAFLYTNRTSVSFGVVLRLDALTASKKTSVEIFEHALAHPALAPLLRGGTMREYGCHLVAEGGLDMLGTIHADGIVVVGDAAGLTINTGLTIRGMDFALGSGLAAAAGISEALASGDTSAAGLAAYRRRFEQHYLYQDLRTYAKAPHLLATATDLYDRYPDLMGDFFHRMYGLDASARSPLRKVALAARSASAIPWRQLLRDGWRAMRSL